jgi:hypothetical protein
MKTLLSTLVMMMSLSAFAGICTVKIDRTPCPGKTEEARKPYDGKNPTEEKKKVDTAKACEDLAAEKVKIVRAGVLAEKKATASYDGKDLGKNFNDKKECK